MTSPEPTVGLRDLGLGGGAYIQPPCILAA
ncbi:MAG: hypothetical protein K0Q52_3831 [Microbacterium sp.]|nr:hypothetical protein [Microbacterium sp.]